MENQKIDPTISYDVVELPSKGICYPNGKKSVRVSYLTASDENILTSLNLMNSGNMVIELLRRKIMDTDIDVEDIIEEDKQAIMIFLRNTAFGGEYKVTAVDPKTNIEFTSNINLEEISVKDFTLVPDSKNQFNYHFSKSNVNVKFKFLTKKQENELRDMEQNWKHDTPAPVITKRMEMMIVEVDGNNDPMFIYNFVKNLPIKDSLDFRKFVKDNKPGLNLTYPLITPSKETIQIEIGFGVEFFRPFYIV